MTQECTCFLLCHLRVVISGLPMFVSSSALVSKEVEDIL